MNGPNNAIGWCDYTWNPVTGCKLGCKFGASGARCYAEGIARRFAGGKAFPNGFEPTFHPHRLDEPLKVKTPSRIFVCSMGELFGPWVPEEWRQAVLEAIRRAPQHQFIMLTKVPRIARRYKMPDNVWLGTTITGDLPHEARRLAYVREFQAPVRFLSIEPLVAPVDVSAADPGLDHHRGSDRPGRIPATGTLGSGARGLCRRARDSRLREGQPEGASGEAAGVAYRGADHQPLRGFVAAG